MTRLIAIEPLFKVTQVELVYRNRVRAADRPHIGTSRAAYHLFLKNWDHNQIKLVEEFKIMLLDARNGCMGIAEISKGGTTATVADPKIVFATALKARATNLILAHNHPSGNPEPSQGDFQLTRKFKEAGDILDMTVADHLIITPDRYFSFADQGRLDL